jgi:hypothetical protein
MVAGDSVRDIRIPHKGNIARNVIDGAFDVLDTFDLIREQTDSMRGVELTALNSTRSPVPPLHCATTRLTRRPPPCHR